MYELFGTPRAGSAAVEIALECCSVDYRVINAEDDHNALLRINPLGQLPMASVIVRWSVAREHLRSAKPEFHAMLMLIDRHPLVRAVCERHWPS